MNFHKLCCVCIALQKYQYVKKFKETKISFEKIQGHLTVTGQQIKMFGMFFMNSEYNLHKGNTHINSVRNINNIYAEICRSSTLNETDANDTVNNTLCTIPNSSFRSTPTTRWHYSSSKIPTLESRDEYTPTLLAVVAVNIIPL